jgi:UDP-3-O-[3-hydroxymyristoyl] glucosamine N-acyltransferase
MANLLFRIECSLRNILIRMKGKMLKFFLSTHGCKVGKGLRCHSFPRFRIPPHGNYFIGNHVTVGNNICFEVFEDAMLIIGDRVRITQDILISAGRSVTIGKNSLIGERVSIRDGNHSIGANDLILNQPQIYNPVIIGEDVWIAAGCFVLGGSLIPDGVVIGANSTVLSKSKLLPNSVYAGNPVIFKKVRN